MPNAGFREIAEHLRSLIGADDGWTAGAALPSEAQLSGEWGVTRTTIRRALGILEEEGLIEAVPGRGRFVRSTLGTPSRQPATRLEEVASAIQNEITSNALSGRLESEAALAQRFKVSPGTVRESLKRLADEGIVTAVHGRGWFVNDPQQPLTLTDQIANKIRETIKSGQLSPGSELPGEKLLAAEYEVSRVTARRALLELESEGLIAKEPGRGRVVVKQHGK